MNTRNVFGLFGLGAVAIFSAAQAEAADPVCSLRSSSGSCLFWSGSLNAKLGADKLTGGPNVQYVFFLDVTPKTPVGVNPVTGVIACANKGSGNLSPGIQTVLLHDPFPDIYDANAANIGINTSSTTSEVPKYQVTLTTTIDAAFDQYCPNTNWTATDAVPCAAEMNVTLFKNGTLSTLSAPVSCHLDSCETLQIDRTKPFGDPLFGHFVQKPYLCSQ